MLGHISLITVGRSWVLPREKTVFGGPFTHNDGSCFRMTWVRSLAVFVAEPAVSTLKDSALVIIRVVVKRNCNVLAALASRTTDTQVPREVLEKDIVMPRGRANRRDTSRLRDSTYLRCLRVASNFSFAALVAGEIQTYPLRRVLRLIAVAVCGRDGLLARRIIGHVHVGSGSGPSSGSEGKMGRIPSDGRRWCHVLLDLG